MSHGPWFLEDEGEESEEGENVETISEKRRRPYMNDVSGPASGSNCGMKRVKWVSMDLLEHLTER